MRDTGTHRHARLRLARQRPAPDAVRARVRAEEPSPAWWRRVPWIGIGTVLTAIGAVGGLIFTGIATYYGALISADQLQQSREDSGKESRAHAAAVSYWAEGREADWTLHLQNRSPDPVPWARVAIIVSADTELSLKDPHAASDIVQYALVTTRLAPCTELIYSPKQLDKVIYVRSSRPGRPEKTTVRKVLQLTAVEYAIFSDRDGKVWKRTDRALEPWSGDPAKAGTMTLWGGELIDEPQVQRAAACGDKG